MNPVSVAIVLALLVLALVLMAVGWRRRTARQRDLVVPGVPADVGAPVQEADGMLVATTFAGRPLDRVVAAGLGFRARVHVTVTGRGVLLDRAGGAPVFLSSETLTGTGTATWTVDRVVERGGLLVLGWSLPSTTGLPRAVESSLRLPAADQRAVLGAVGALVHPAAAARPAASPVGTTPEVPRADHAD